MKNENKISSDENKLSAIQKRRLKEFNMIREDLLNQGYKEKSLIITPLKANMMVFITTAPLIIICYAIFVSIYGKVELYNILSVELFISVFLGIVVHEIIHGITWASFCKNKWKAIGFGVDWETITPYCCCNESLTLKKYALGCAMPTIILGILPYILSLITGNYFILMFSLFLILCGGGDAYILWIIRKENDSIMLDHPYLVGCVAFKKE